MPLGNQSITAFGAAANLVHPATGYSIARMFHESGPLATTMADTLSRNNKVGDYAHDVWETLWPQEKRTQVCRVNICAHSIQLQSSPLKSTCTSATLVALSLAFMSLHSCRRLSMYSGWSFWPL